MAFGNVWPDHWQASPILQSGPTLVSREGHGRANSHARDIELGPQVHGFPVCPRASELPGPVIAWFVASFCEISEETYIRFAAKLTSFLLRSASSTLAGNSRKRLRLSTQIASSWSGSLGGVSQPSPLRSSSTSDGPKQGMWKSGCRWVHRLSITHKFGRIEPKLDVGEAG